jgi:hypothetical protein
MDALDQAFPTASAESWKWSAAMATIDWPGPDTQISPTRRPQVPTARRANGRWPHAAVIATAGGAMGAFVIAAAILFAPTAAAKSGEYVQVCTGPHNVTAATCQPGVLRQVPLGGATPEGCHRTGPVSTACGRRTDHVDPSDAGGAHSTITSPQSGSRPNSTSSRRFSPTHTQKLHATSHR